MKILLELEPDDTCTEFLIIAVHENNRRYSVKDKYEYRPFICDAVLRDLFEIPENVKKAFITITSKEPSGKDYYRARFTYEAYLYIHHDGKYNYYSTGFSTDDLLTDLELNGKSMYIWLSTT